LTARFGVNAKLHNERGVSTMNATTRRHAAGELAHLQTLEDAVDDYFVFRHGARHNGDPVLIHTKTAISLFSAIKRACAGVDVDGIKSRHDQYLRPSAVEDLQRNLIEHMDGLRLATSFDALHDRIRSLRPKGIGDLKVFDVTMRLGAYLNIDIDRSDYVYLHRGALVGWQALTGQRARPYRVPFDSVPAALQVLPHYMVEDFFCEYRTWLRPELLMREAA
jgi:hypothetical protein